MEADRFADHEELDNMRERLEGEHTTLDTLEWAVSEARTALVAAHAEYALHDKAERVFPGRVRVLPMLGRIARINIRYARWIELRRLLYKVQDGRS